MNCANRSQCPGGSSDLGPFAQYSAITFCSSVSSALRSTRSLACCKNVAEPNNAGPKEAMSGRNWSAEIKAKGVTFDHCAPTKVGVTIFFPLKYVRGCQWLGSMMVEISLTGTVLGLLTGV